VAGRDPRTLELISDEAARQIGDVAQREANAVSRAGFLVAAGGLGGAAAVGVGDHVATVLAFGSFVCALFAIVLWNSKAVVLTEEMIGLWIPFGPSVLAERILADRAEELRRRRLDLGWKNRFIALSLGLLILATVVAAISWSIRT
jgi:hypothetical protein